jgi:pyruvate kinase
VTLTTRPVAGRPGVVPISDPDLARRVRPGDPVLLDDGRIELRVLRRSGREIHCRVRVGGLLGAHKGVNLPRALSGGAALTAKDRDDLDFVLRQGVDYVGLSFARGAADVAAVRRLIGGRGRDVRVVVKLERRAAVEGLGAILEVADGVMVARGDLGVEVPLERVPVLQKRILQEAHRCGVLAITATEMLESMVLQPRPTRAEASDVANAIFDGTDAVMLSAETATGRHPVRAVAVMDRIVREAEASGLGSPARAETGPGRDPDLHAVAHAACDAAGRAAVRAIVVHTQTGTTARMLSKLKPSCPIIAIAPSEAVRRRMALYRGVLPLAVRLARATDRMLRDGERAILARRVLARGDRVVVVSGTSPHAGATNLMKLHRLGDEA